MDFSEHLIEEWESDSIIFVMPKEARLHLLHLTGITSYHIANFYKWISVIDCDLLGIFLDLYSIDENTLARSQNHNEGKFELWKESFAPTKNPEEFDGNFIFRSNALSTYRALGNDFHAASASGSPAPVSVMSTYGSDLPEIQSADRRFAAECNRTWMANSVSWCGLLMSTGIARDARRLCTRLFI